MDSIPTLLFTEFHYVISLLDEMLPPNFSILWTNETIGISVLQTISMAFLGTLIGGTVALMLSFLAASNTTPSQTLRLIVKALLSFERVIPSLVIILIFVISVGLGAFAGMLTLALGTIGMFGKLFSEALENAELGPAEAIYSREQQKFRLSDMLYYHRCFLLLLRIFSMHLILTCGRRSALEFLVEVALVLNCTCL